MDIKRTVLVGATVATVAVSGGGIAMAASNMPGTIGASGTSLVDKIAAKFNLNKADVQAVFTANRTERQANMEAAQKTRLAQAVTDGKLTQAQADHITSVHAEITALHSSTPGQAPTSAVRDQIRTKIQDLRTWATDNNVDMQYVMGGRGMGRMHGTGSGQAGTGTTKSDATLHSTNADNSNAAPLTSIE